MLNILLFCRDILFIIHFRIIIVQKFHYCFNWNHTLPGVGKDCNMTFAGLNAYGLRSGENGSELERG